MVFPVLFFLALGAILGSFLNVAIHRLPRHQSVVSPPSTCPACGARILPYDNLPLLSFILLRGRCRHCSAKISPRYPLVEALTALCTAGLYGLLGLNLSLAIYLPFTWALITLPGIALSALVPLLGSLRRVAWSPGVARLSVEEWGLGILLGGGIPYLVAAAYRLAQFRKLPAERIDGMGMGDVKMLAMVGGFLGWKLVLMTILMGSVLGSLWGLSGVALSRYGMKQALPFGTFLAVGAFIALAGGPILLAWYAGISGFPE